MGPRQLSCYRSPDPRILSRRRRIWSRGGRTRRPDVGRRLSPQPETQHPPVGGEVLIGLVARAASVVPTRRHQAPSVWVMTTISGSHRPAGAKGEAQRAAQRRPRVEAAADRPGPKSRGKGALRQSRICDLWRWRGGPAAARGDPVPRSPFAAGPMRVHECGASRAADWPPALPSPFKPNGHQARLAARHTR